MNDTTQTTLPQPSDYGYDPDQHETYKDFVKSNATERPHSVGSIFGMSLFAGFFGYVVGIVPAAIIAIASGSTEAAPVVAGLVGLVAVMWGLITFSNENAAADANQRTVEERWPNVPQMEQAHMAWMQAVSATHERADEIRRQNAEFWKGLGGHEFEHALTKTLIRGGWDASTTQASNDGGVDIEATCPKGVEYIIQCKRYKKPVGVGHIRDMAGASTLYEGNALPVVAAPSGFTLGAKEAATSLGIHLWEMDDLLKMAS